MLFANDNVQSNVRSSLVYIMAYFYLGNITPSSSFEVDSFRHFKATASVTFHALNFMN